IAFEVAATSVIGRTVGFTQLAWTVGVLSGYAISFFMMAQAVRELEIGLVYAVWSGVGTAAIVRHRRPLPRREPHRPQARRGRAHPRRRAGAQPPRRPVRRRRVRALRSG